MYFNKTLHNYSLSGPHDTDDIEKVSGSKVKVKTAIVTEISL